MNKLYITNTIDNTGEAMALDIAAMSRRGYSFESHHLVNNGYSAGQWFIAMLLCWVGIGFILVLIMMLNKPEDKIEIIYSYTGTVPSSKPVHILVPSGSQPMLAESTKVRAFDSATGKEIDVEVI